MSPRNPRSKAWMEEHDRLLDELYRLHDQGLTRSQAHTAMNGKRGISWIKKFWPSRIPSTKISKTRSEFESSIARLKELRALGYSVSEAVRSFSGEHSENWTRRHWQRIEKSSRKETCSYSHMDVQTQTVLVPSDE